MEPSDNPDLSQPTISTLLSQSQSQQILFRIHTPTSNSPLIWTGELSTSGFLSPNIHLGSLTPKSYIPFLNYSSSTGSHLISSSTHEINPGVYLRHTVIDHILNKSKQTCIPTLPTIEETKEGAWPDERTPWISASENLFRTIWDITRRLAVPQGEFGWVGGVQLAIVRHPKSTYHRMHMEQINRISKEDLIDGRSQNERNQDEKSISTPREIWLRPTNVLSPPMYPGEMSLALKESYEVSRKMASQSGEILFFGRIWAENVLSNLEWTCEETPFPLPAHLFLPTYDPCDRSQRWIDHLIWNPRNEDYLIAYEKVMNRKRQECGKRGEWPKGPL
ncbi:hypothetical protein V865_001385 [Kwoniella europaea PYCC6329]|uniref:Uncharacterized protein n=1 Tax=Kwoniella europaea PYCC6329 TaxID=1423913 RepID=A0AAX4KBX0_9TREE